MKEQIKARIAIAEIAMPGPWHIATASQVDDDQAFICSAGTHYLADLRRLLICIEALEQTTKRLDSIKFSLDSSVYTVTDDEFETIFYVRYQAHAALGVVSGERTRL